MQQGSLIIGNLLSPLSIYRFFFFFFDEWIFVWMIWKRRRSSGKCQLIYLCFYIIALDASMQVWSRSQLKWRLLITTTIMYVRWTPFVHKFIFHCLTLLNNFLVFDFLLRVVNLTEPLCSLMQLAFFTTRKVEALEELTWVSWFGIV